MCRERGRLPFMAIEATIRGHQFVCQSPTLHSIDVSEIQLAISPIRRDVDNTYKHPFCCNTVFDVSIVLLQNAETIAST